MGKDTIGMNWYMDQNIVSHTYGSYSTATLSCHARRLGVVCVPAPGSGQIYCQWAEVCQPTPFAMRPAAPPGQRPALPVRPGIATLQDEPAPDTTTTGRR